MLVGYSESEVERLTETLGTVDRAQQLADLARRELERLSDELASPDHHEDLSASGIDLDGDESLDESVLRHASQRYERSIETRLVNHLSIAELAGAVTYLVCRTHRIPRTREEVGFASVFGALAEGKPRSERLQARRDAARTVSKAYQKVSDEFNVNLTPIEPERFVRRYHRELQLPDDVLEVALVVLRQVSDDALSGVASHSFAAGVILYAVEQADVDLTQRKIYRALSVWPDTLRNQRDNVERALGG